MNEANLDVVIAEDDSGAQVFLVDLVRANRLNPLIFGTVRDAMGHLRTNRTPRAIISDINTGCDTDPREIYILAAKLGLSGNFVYASGNYSKRDQEIMADTGATHFLKTDVHLLDGFLQKVYGQIHQA